ncbi:tRNA (N6-isopentenyl adenosine(37)-C2)-methylthiotransferase MiaB [bacterium]|nr:tRNA (N6-isopentenyl adenosine(37)-C2)-methylthiotransferase MiaB [bacterium]
MTRPTYKIISYGCQMNAYDSELMAGVLEAKGYSLTDSEKDSDVLLVNTCIVRGSAEERALGRLAKLKALKQERPDRILGVCGCLAQRDAEALFDRFPHLDLVLGTRAIPSLPELLDRLGAGERPLASVEECEHPYQVNAVPVRKSSLRTLVPIMSGCNNWCSYCIVPQVRGREVSRPAGTILDEIRALVQVGTRDVTLVGQNVNSYHDGRTDFANLLGKINDINDLLRIRYITSHPRDANARHVDAVSSLSKVCDHFHLPVQSGSNRVLDRMNRGYTREHYMELVEGIRDRLPEATITTDIIVGFPGETQAEYEETIDLVENVRFDSAFTFFYNVRVGTRAADWPDDVPLEEKKTRLSRLIELQERISLEKNQGMIGRQVEVLSEGPARRKDRHGGSQLVGRTTGDKCVVYTGKPEDVGRLVPLSITDAAAHTLFGKAAE